MTDEIRQFFEQLRNHISKCVNCDCKFVDVISSLDLEDKKSSLVPQEPNSMVITKQPQTKVITSND